MSRSFVKILSISVLMFSFLTAQSVTMKGDKAPGTELPDSGVLSVQGGVGYTDLTIRKPWGGPGAPVTGTVMKVNGRDWKISMQNISDKSYSMSMSFEQYGQVSNKLKRKKANPFQVRLKPGETKDHTVKGVADTVGGALIVRSWKELG